MAEDRPLAREYSIDDQSIRNIVAEIFAEDDSDVREYLTRITDLIENIEIKKINILINYLLYGMILNDASSLLCMERAAADIALYMQGYVAGLDAVDAELHASRNMTVSTLPALVDQLRSDENYYKNNKKEIDRLVSLLPDVKGNLERIVKYILVPE